ncbi:MAG: zinc ABC transporter substrate-binding protein [Clostridia bacterium]|nr:zinc ABC transporter substrate-binding protein [Clostridia bacterium]MBR5365066.1 zinc ABC transporter substrate-binding protein [Clostridia bacterium]
MRRILSLFLSLVLLTGLFSSCLTAEPKPSGDKPLVVATNFVLYDTARTLAGDLADVRMLLPPGADAHEYEMTLADTALVAESDFFLYIGGESEDWVDDLFASMKEEDRPKSFRALDTAGVRNEEEKEGMQTDEDEEEEEDAVDEHVWTSFENLLGIAEQIDLGLCELCPKQKDVLLERLDAYKEEVKEIRAAYRETVDGAARRTLVFADRFPFLYLVKELGLDYYAAFSGCSSNVEASLATIHFLVTKVQDEGIPAVFIIELSDGKCAEAVARETGCAVLTLYSGHNVTPAEFEAGISYFDLLRRNLEALKTALNG